MAEITIMDSKKIEDITVNDYVLGSGYEFSS